MNVPSVWHAPGHTDRYRARVFAARERPAGESTDPRGAQRRVLADLLGFNASTGFGGGHGFGRVRTMDDFRTAVPVRDHAAPAPLIGRTAAGERNLLSADAPAVCFTSSGTTGPRFMRSTASGGG
ncbi:GH3 family domain-containing protein [Streptomyces jumonjinensis]|uniref:GH3 auxin-responsive promoter family protein n=1 Tax=Streptomyces jumonjinensis TaxID=1945 RepID=A0A646KAA6_STRJU|nr:GH3 auxin-responsive promoter family protein [Streptomyces jumonjinensis]MQS99057.1 GH3 auxin-responsive promoter family protein [Streptomyces jumonjinensis]